jgi:preprotein translocase subunit Sec61beta
MAEGISTPSGMGGLMRFSDEYPSKLRISPEMVIILIAAVVVGVTFLKLIIQ